MKNNILEDKIKDLYLKNKTYNEISKILGVSKKEILKYVKESELYIERKERNIQIIQEGLEKKLSRNQIAEILGITPAKVSNLAGYYKIPTTFKKIRFEKQEELILREYKKLPVSTHKMAEQTGILYSTCRIIYKKHNLISVVSRKGHYKKLSKEETNTIIKEIKKGETSLSQIGKEHNVSRQWIACLKKRNNL